MLSMLTSEHDVEADMGSAMRSIETYDLERPSFLGLRLRLNALLRWFGVGRRQRADACWPDGLNDQYLRDAGLEHGARHEISGSALHQLRIGPRA
jgi:hypothetical protein